MLPNNLRFLFPSDYFQPRSVDCDYADRACRLQLAGFAIAVISLENLELGNAKIYPPLAVGEVVIYQGWMLSPDRYDRLNNAVVASGARLWIDRDEYLRTHYLPNWYPLLADLTPETHIFNLDDDLEAGLLALGWEQFFIKDYVKSLKTSRGAIASTPTEAMEIIAEMQKFRGTIEGGICIRKVEHFIPQSERRYFAIRQADANAIDGRVFAADPHAEIPELARICAERIDSKFVTIDIIDRDDGCQRVVEVGDGQVSGLTGWSSERFASLWRELGQA